MDKIYVNQMEFYGYHGVFQEETKLGQRFIVDLVVEVDVKQAGETDNLEYSVHYGELYNLCRDVVEGAPFKLIEALAEKITKMVLEHFTLVSSCTVKVIKPDPPIPGHLQSVAVEITRNRHDE
jgi:7,8-dihydroneopterin aldolase/epimerase/oxygenase